jgi:hypothetical protein
MDAFIILTTFTVVIYYLIINKLDKQIVKTFYIKHLVYFIGILNMTIYP